MAYASAYAQRGVEMKPLLKNRVGETSEGPVQAATDVAAGAADTAAKAADAIVQGIMNVPKLAMRKRFRSSTNMFFLHMGVFSSHMMRMMAFVLVLLGTRAIMFEGMTRALNSGLLNVDTAVLERASGFFGIQIITAFSYAAGVLGASWFVVHLPDDMGIGKSAWFTIFGWAAQCVGGVVAVMTLLAAVDAKYLNNAIPRVTLDGDSANWGTTDRARAIFTEVTGYLIYFLVAGYFESDMTVVNYVKSEGGLKEKALYLFRTTHSFTEQHARLVPVGYAAGVLLTVFKTGACLNPIYAICTRIALSMLYRGNKTLTSDPAGDHYHNVWDGHMWIYIVAFFVAYGILAIARLGSLFMHNGVELVGTAAESVPVESSGEADYE